MKKTAEHMNEMEIEELRKEVVEMRNGTEMLMDVVEQITHAINLTATTLQRITKQIAKLHGNLDQEFDQEIDEIDKLISKLPLAVKKKGSA